MDVANNPRSEELIKNLNDKVVAAQAAYYRGEPIMTDAEYDVLEARLKALVQSSPWLANLAPALQKPGHDDNGNGRIPHQVPMLSIENQYTEEDFLAQFDGWGGVPVVLEPKFDGISASLQYHNGRLVQALTRGDGISGEVITDAVYACPSIPLMLTSTAFPNNAGTFEIRGEMVMRTSTLERINAKLKADGVKTYASTRNLTAGTMKLKDYNLVASREIQFRPWDCIGDGLPSSRISRLETLNRKEGFAAPQGVLVSKREDIIPALRKLLELNKTSDINADGVVMKVDDVAVCQRLGLSSKFTNYQTCFKPQSAAGTTYLRRIIWQMGRQGKLTPVAECDPVVLAGAVVTRANLNNLTWIEAMGLKLGAKVEMLRSGDVIPQITKVLDDTGEVITAPVNCPDCGSKLEALDEGRTGIITHWCENGLCPGRVKDLFAYVGSRDQLEIDGLGPELAGKLVNDGFAVNMAQLFEFGNDCKAALDQLGDEGFVKRCQKQGFSSTLLGTTLSMQKAKKAPWDRWFACLGIPMIGQTLGKVLAIQLELTSDSMAELCDKLALIKTMDIEGIGFRKEKEIEIWIKQPGNRDLCAALYAAGVRPAPMALPKTGNQPLKGVAFCITGEFSEDRGSLERKLESLGAVAKSGVSSKCNLLVVGDSAGRTKLNKAASLGIKQVDKDWLEQVLTENGLSMKAATFAVEEI